MNSLEDHNQLHDHDMPALATLILNRRDSFSLTFDVKQGDQISADRRWELLIKNIREQGRARGLGFHIAAESDAFRLLREKASTAREAKIGPRVRISLAWDYLDAYLADNPRPSPCQLQLMFIVRWMSASRKFDQAQKFHFAR